jgi:choline dehydrogenase-like flavoprotein
MTSMPSFIDQEVDVCIVGSGAGGAPLARALSEAGARVVVLEKGPWYQQGDFDHDEISNCRRDKWVPYVSDEPHLVQSGRAKKPSKSNFGWTANCVGGGTVHMSGFFYRLAPEDFAMKKRYGDLPGASLADWPITYEELAPFYDQVEAVVGLSGEAGGHPFEPPRNGPYPLPPLAENPMAALVDEGAKKLGLHPFKTPRAILSKPHRGRAACVYCDYCGSYGCESGAKGSALAAFLPDALKTGRCEIRAHCMAAEVLTSDDGTVTGVRYLDQQKKSHVQKAKLVCVSATAIESARLLLNSKSKKFPNGLANTHGLVGKNLHFSTLAKGYGMFRKTDLPKAMQAHHPIHFVQRSLRDFYFIKERKGEYDKGGTLNYMLPHRNPIFTADRIARRSKPPMWGERLQKSLHRYYTEARELEFEVFGEFLPNPKTRVEVDSDVRDRWGLPVARIHIQNHPEDFKNSKILVNKGLEVLKAAGAAKTAVESVGGTTDVLQHGTCRFGEDPKASVLNKFCQAHDVGNLYVVDGSFMPSSGGVPTTLTIMANAMRVAEHLVGRVKKGDFGITVKKAAAPTP